MKLFLSLLLLLAGFALWAQPYAIGHVSVNFKDNTRTGGFAIGGASVFPAGGTGRDIGTEIYYPATSTGNNTPFAAGRFPVIVFGHGFAMTWDAYTTFFDSMARNGYIVALARTEGSLLPAPSHLDFGKDLSKIAALITQADTTTGTVFNSKLNGRIAIGGHSMGGGATFLADAYAPANVVCYFTFAAAETSPSAVAASKLITRPHLVFSGTYDCVAPPAQHQNLMYDTLGSVCKTQISLTKGYHCAFADNNFNCGFGEGTCITAGGLSSTVQQAMVRMYLLPYLQYYLYGVCPAWPRFQTLLDTATIATVKRSCNNTVPLNAAITGNSFFCSGDSTLLTATPAGFSYVWNNGDTAQATNIKQGGNYAVTISNSTCAISSSVYPVAEKAAPISPTNFLAGDTFCAGVSNIALAVDNDTLADFYNWNLPPGWVITGGGSTHNIQVTTGNAGGTIAVTAINNCGISPVVQKSVVVNSGPESIGPIMGNDTVCLVQDPAPFSIWINAVAGATVYNWILPSNWNAIGSVTDTTVMISATSSGTIGVYATNTCGNSDTVSKSVVVSHMALPMISQNGDTLYTNNQSVAYQWYFNGQEIPGANGQSYVATQTGSYTVRLTNAENCSAEAFEYSFVYTGINGVGGQGLQVYPNPASNKFFVLMGGSSTGVAQLFSTDGRLLLNHTMMPGLNQIDVSAIAPGMYILHIPVAENSKQIKMFLE